MCIANTVRLVAVLGDSSDEVRVLRCWAASVVPSVVGSYLL